MLMPAHVRYRYAYTLAHPGRWISLNLKKPKKKAGGGRRKAKVIMPAAPVQVREDGEEDEDEYRSEDEQEVSPSFVSFPDLSLQIEN